MAILNLIAGDYDYSAQGHHVCDDRGIAIKLTELKSIEVDQEVHDRVMQQLIFDRVNNRGLNEDGSEKIADVPVESAPEPAPEPVPVSEEQVQ